MDAQEFYERGKRFFQQGNLDRAADDFSSVICRNSMHADAYFYRGKIRRSKGKFKEALDDFKNAMKYCYFHGSSNQREIENEIRALQPLFQQESEERTKRALNSANDHIEQLERQIDDLERENSDLREKIRRLEQQLKPQSPAVDLCNQGNEYFEQGKLDLALTSFRKAVDLAPNLPEAYEGRAKVYETTGEFGLSMKDFKKALELRAKM